MISPNNHNPPSISRSLQIILTVIIAIIILVVIGFISGVFSPSPPTPEPVADPGGWPTSPVPTPTYTPSPTPWSSPPPPDTPTPSPTPTPIVIDSWRELGTLITIEYTLQTVVEAERERVFPLSPERILLNAVGNVEAGIDLTQIQDADIIIQGTHVQVMLPPAIVTSVELLPEESKIYDSNRGWLLSEYEGLEIEAMNQARFQLEDWAIHRADLLSKAEELAQAQLETFLRKLGFEEIEITFKR